MRVSVGEVRLYVDVEGCQLVPDGARMLRRPTVLALHGGPGSDHSSFKPELSGIARLAQVVYLDQRGSGRSDDGTAMDWTWRQWAADVIQLCDALEISRPILLGRSCGGWVAITAALAFPDRVGGLVLDSAIPSTLDDTLDTFEARGGAAAREAAHRYMSGERGADVQEAWWRLCLPLYRPPGTTPGDPDRTARIAWNHAVTEHFRTAGCGPFDPWPDLARLRCPTLILAGEHDPVAGVAAARRFRDHVINASVELHELPGVGHGAFAQDTGSAHHLLERFLGRHFPPEPAPAPQRH